MNNVEIDGIKYDVSLLSPAGQSLISVLLESNKRLKESQISVALYSAAAIRLIEELKEHLTDDSIIKAAE
jgi:hypothetical protein|tara:strand:+ start:109 stop:318 length:210 start_codon:yes stop_codon:yes gene_type:complete